MVLRMMLCIWFLGNILWWNLPWLQARSALAAPSHRDPGVERGKYTKPRLLPSDSTSTPAAAAVRTHAIQLPPLP